MPFEKTFINATFSVSYGFGMIYTYTYIVREIWLDSSLTFTSQEAAGSA
jgi:hypothetical protein